MGWQVAVTSRVLSSTPAASRHATFKATKQLADGIATPVVHRRLTRKAWAVFPREHAKSDSGKSPANSHEHTCASEFCMNTRARARLHEHVCTTCMSSALARAHLPENTCARAHSSKSICVFFRRRGGTEPTAKNDALYADRKPWTLLQDRRGRRTKLLLVAATGIGMLDVQGFCNCLPLPGSAWSMFKLRKTDNIFFCHAPFFRREGLSPRNRA